MSSSTLLRETTVKLKDVTAAQANFWGFQMFSLILSTKNLSIHVIFNVTISPMDIFFTMAHIFVLQLWSFVAM